jgi:hypothetical protein
MVMAIIASDTPLEFHVGEMGDQLSENGSAGVHPPLFRSGWPRLSADSGRFQFKSFFGRMPVKPLILRDLLYYAKYFTGQQWRKLFIVSQQISGHFSAKYASRVER